MTPQTAILKLRLRLNKLHSSDYDNIADWIAVEAVNKAALERTRRYLSGIGLTKAGDEENRIRVDDLQFLLKSEKLTGANKTIFFESNLLPKDYLLYKSLRPIVSKGQCKRVAMYSHLVEEANALDYLQDWSMQPSFDWRQTFHTLAGDKIRVYHNNDFLVNELILTYFRKPKRFDIVGYTREDGTESYNQDLEFTDMVAEAILDDAAAIIAGSIESMNAYQVAQQRADKTD